MAIFKVQSNRLNAVEVISRNDDALDLEASDWEAYKETGDVSKLKFIPNKQPTIFLCNFSHKSKESEQIKNAQIGGADDDGKPKIALGSWSFKIAKYSLKDIKNPDYLKEDERVIFKKDGAGFVHDDLLNELENYGVIDDILAMYTSLVLKGARANAKN